MRKGFALFLFAVFPAFVHAAEQEVVSTHCRELEVPLDATHSVARLAGCGEESSANLLWHLDRIDQLDGRLDGMYHRRHAGAGSVVYVMDTGVLASHTEFASPAGSRVIAGFDLTESVPVGNSTCQSENKATHPCYANYNELPGASHGTSVASLVAGQTVGVATEAMIVFPICAFVSFKSSRTTAISGAIPNQATKHTKKANHERWNARMGAVLKSSKRTRVALPSGS